jgi:hypothetical protein
MVIDFHKGRAFPCMFEVVDDFGNTVDLMNDAHLEIDPMARVIPVGAWLFLQGQPLADHWDDDVEQDGLQH